jgi:hypothetical protein
MRILLVMILGFTMLTAGCSRAPALASKVQAAGGTAALVQDCRTILDEHQRSQKEFWSQGDSGLPPTIAALQPQTVHASRYNSYPMVDIQVSGGFSHHGLMVILTNTPSDFMPRKSTWRVTKIAEGIYEYRE